MMNVGIAWIHPYDRLPSMLKGGPDAESVRRAVETMGEEIRASLPARDRPELRLVPGAGRREVSRSSLSASRRR